MDTYGFYPPYPQIQPPKGGYSDRGDGFGDYYGAGSSKNIVDHGKRRSRSKIRTRRVRRTKSRSLSATKSQTYSKENSRSRSHSQSHSRSQSRSRSRSRSRSHSRSISRSRSRSLTVSRRRLPVLKEPSFLDAFRVLYLTPSKQSKATTKYLATKKRQDRVQEILKSDRLGSKRWHFYPRPGSRNFAGFGDVPGSRDNCDQRIKVDAIFFRNYKRSKKIDPDAPITKLKKWELNLYKKLGFIQAV